MVAWFMLKRCARAASPISAGACRISSICSLVSVRQTARIFRRRRGVDIASSGDQPALSRWRMVLAESTLHLGSSSQARRDVHRAVPDRGTKADAEGNVPTALVGQGAGMRDQHLDTESGEGASCAACWAQGRLPQGWRCGPESAFAADFPEMTTPL